MQTEWPPCSWKFGYLELNSEVLEERFPCFLHQHRPYTEMYNMTLEILTIRLLIFILPSVRNTNLPSSSIRIIMTSYCLFSLLVFLTLKIYTANENQLYLHCKWNVALYFLLAGKGTELALGRKKVRERWYLRKWNEKPEKLYICFWHFRTSFKVCLLDKWQLQEIKPALTQRSCSELIWCSLAST